MKEIKTLEDSEYRLVDAISYSGLKQFHHSPIKFIYQKKEPTKPMIFGRAFHEAFLLPDEFSKNAILMPEFSRKKEDLDKKQIFLEENKNKTILSKEDDELIFEMICKLRSVPLINKMFSNGDPESSFFWKDAETNLDCKCRVDFINQDMGMIIDLKTISSADKETTKREIISRMYDMQAAFYLDHVSKIRNFNFTNFIIVAIEKEYPFEVKIYNIDHSFIERGRRLYRTILNSYSDFKMNMNYNNDFVNEIDLETLECPTWARVDNENL